MIVAGSILLLVWRQLGLCVDRWLFGISIQGFRTILGPETSKARPSACDGQNLQDELSGRILGRISGIPFARGLPVVFDTSRRDDGVLYAVVQIWVRGLRIGIVEGSGC
jgi:hypothetical protein